MASQQTKETVISPALAELKTRVARIRENRVKSHKYSLERQRTESRREALRQKVRALKAEAAEIEAGEIDPEGIAEAAARLSQIELEIRLTERAAAAIQDPPVFTGYTGTSDQRQTLEFLSEFITAQTASRLEQLSAFMAGWGATPPAAETRFIAWQALSGACPMLREAASLERRVHMGPGGENVFSELLELIEKA